MKTEYVSLLGHAQGAAKIHVHLSRLDAEIGGQGYQHSHQAEEAIYLLEGEAEYAVGGRVRRLGPGELIFFPPGEPHGALRFLRSPIKYLVIRNVEPGEEERCCCGQDLPPRTTGG